MKLCAAKKSDKDLDKELHKRIEKMVEEEMGVEYEDNDEEAENDKDYSEEKPFDAEKIRVDQQMLSVKYMLELMEHDMIDLSPEYQRHPVWKDNKKKSLLIESLMLRIPIPAFYFYEQKSGKYQVIDGQQRLLTIKEFVGERFKLSGLEYLGDKYNQKKFSDLEMKYVQRIYRTQIAVNVLDARSPRRVIYDIFRRVNTGGVSLNPQEMRNAICNPEVRKFLKKSIKNENYLKATRRKVKDIRMDAQELVLRFYAFYMIYDYKNDWVDYTFPSIATLLDHAIEKLNMMEEKQKEKLYQLFDLSMKRCFSAFGDYSFSKLQIENNEISRARDYINKSLFSAFSVLLLHPKYETISLNELNDKQSEILNNLARKLQEQKYVNAITNATGDKRNVAATFAYSKEVLESV